MFGPGVGECVVVHLGAGRWMVVDSCLNDSGDEPVALEYLRSLNVDVASQVVLLVLTHFHDDHVRGAAQLFREAQSARFVCSAALSCREFFQLIDVSSQVRAVTVPSSLVEVREIFEELQERAERRRRSPAAPHAYAQHDMTLHEQPTSGGTVTVRSLSPSSQEVHEARLRFCERIPEVGEQIRRVPEFRPNDATVALLIESETCGVLLGGDLEVTADEQRGWHAVVNSPNRPGTKCDIVKIPHHGSENGDYAGMWNTLLHPDPWAAVTPYAKGRKPLPSEPDVERLKQRTSRLYCTAYPPTRRPVKENKTVTRALNELTRQRRSVSRSVGHVRLRASLEKRAPVQVELRNGALKL